MSMIFLRRILIIIGSMCLMVSATKVPSKKRGREVESMSALMLSGESKRDIRMAIKLLGAGDAVALPTETVYGLAADARNAVAVNKIFAAKGRPADHPLIVHIESFEKISEWTNDVSPYAKQLADAFWPGPLTMCFKKKSEVLDEVTGGLPTVCLRVPSHPVFLDILEALNTGLAAPSANHYKGVSPTTAMHVFNDIGGKIAAIVDGGPCDKGVESTIIDLTGAVPCILRPGPITKEQIEAVLGVPVMAPAEHAAHVPGNVLEHYQPRTSASLMSLESIKAYIDHPHNSLKRFAVVHYEGLDPSLLGVVSFAMPATRAEYEHYLYGALHDADEIIGGVDEILIQRPPADWVAALDRLRRATAKTSSRRKESVSY